MGTIASFDPSRMIEPFAELLFDLRKRQINCFAAFVGHGSELLVRVQN